MLAYKNRVVINGTSCICLKSNYVKGGNQVISLQLIDEEDFLPYATATVYVPEISNLLIKHTGVEMAIIKNYSENEGIEEPLIKAGILKDLLGKISNEFVTLPIYAINNNPKDLVEADSIII